MQAAALTCWTGTCGQEPVHAAMYLTFGRQAAKQVTVPLTCRCAGRSSNTMGMCPCHSSMPLDSQVCDCLQNSDIAEHRDSICLPASSKAVATTTALFTLLYVQYKERRVRHQTQAKKCLCWSALAPTQSRVIDAVALSLGESHGVLQLRWGAASRCVECNRTKSIH